MHVVSVACCCCAGQQITDITAWMNQHQQTSVLCTLNLTLAGCLCACTCVCVCVFVCVQAFVFRCVPSCIRMLANSGKNIMRKKFEVCFTPQDNKNESTWVQWLIEVYINVFLLNKTTCIFLYLRSTKPLNEIWHRRISFLMSMHIKRVTMWHYRDGLWGKVTSSLQWCSRVGVLLQ